MVRAQGGAHARTNRPPTLAWLRDVLDILTGHGIGLAFWSFRGPFGILDSARADVQYEDWHGHALDRSCCGSVEWEGEAPAEPRLDA